MRTENFIYIYTNIYMKFLSTTMVNNSRGDARAQQEGEISDIKSSSSTTTTTSGSRQLWAAGFKNPRIVRVSRSFGGKDRHSKVCTIRGLKDRRIRLSVPSAIQLYDLQDRLGLNQPSKVVDWLLDNTKDDIDKLPPLQMPSGDFTQFYHHHHQQTLAPHHELYTPQSNSLSPFFDINSQFMKDGIIQFFGKGLHKINNDNPDEDSHMVASRKSKLYLATTSLDAAADLREKHKELVDRENLVDDKWNVPDNYEGCSDHRVISCSIPQLSAQNFLPLINQLSFPSIISNTAALPYTREPPSLSLSQFGISQVLFPSQVLQSQSDTHSAAANSVLHPLAQSTPSQYLLYPPAVTTPLFPPQYHSHLSTTTNNSSIENDPRSANHFPFMSSSGSQNLIIPNSDIVSPFHFINPFSCVNTKENLQKNEDTTK